MGVITHPRLLVGWCGVLLTSVLLMVGHAEDVGRLQGVVQREGHVLAHQRIMLIRFGPNEDVQRFPGQTDADGRFVFEHLAVGPTWTYVVGIRYEEQLYRSDSVTLTGAEPVEVLLTVSAVSAAVKPDGVPAAEKPTLRIANHLMAIRSHATSLEVREIIRLVNPGSTPYTAVAPGPRGTPGVSLHLPLPHGHYNVAPIQGLLPEATRVESRGISYTAPIAPGEHEVVYTYHLPWQATLMTILFERTLATAMFDVLVEDEQLNATSDLRFGGRVPVPPHVFAHFRGMQLEAGTRAWLQLIPRQTSTSLLSLGAYSLIVGLALGGGLWPCYRAWRQPGKQTRATAEAQAEQQDWQQTGWQLLHSMARLDDAYAHGSVEAATYHQRRQAYQEQLVHMVEHYAQSRAPKAS